MFKLDFLLLAQVRPLCIGVVASLALLTPLQASDPPQGGVIFEDVAAALGVTYERARSATFAFAQAFRDESLVTPKTLMDVPSHPLKARGAPGVAVLDYDGDGDLDIYVTNGPGAANSLLSSQLQQTGTLGFTDVAATAGVDASGQDSTGVCYADIDNDGDEDLYVLGRNEPNRLFENNANGTFSDITTAAGVGEGSMGSASCSFGDVNNDGLLDLYVANVTDFKSMAAILAIPFALNQPDTLFVNSGGNAFTDVSAVSGIRDLVGVPDDSAGLTWAVALVDVDQDGDTDILTASDNGAIPFAAEGGVDRGFLRVFENDGSGAFSDVTDTAGLLGSPGDWMGISVSDLNHDGTLDAFVTNTGDYFEAFLGLPGAGLGGQTSRHFLQNADGTFTDGGVDPTLASVFGWGTSMVDYDNDGDSDVAYVGGLDVGLIVDASNPGVILQNDGAANFIFDRLALAPPLSADHVRRFEHGMAVGDLDGNGFVDMVSVSNQNAPPPIPLVLYAPVIPITFMSPFNALASFVPVFSASSPGSFVWTGLETPNGSLAIEMNSGGNGNGSAEVRLFGSVGITSNGVVNRDGIGGVVTFEPLSRPAAIRPVLGGSSHASQHSLALSFGLGHAPGGRVEVLWPGGVRNRLYDVEAGERVLFPEIPCSFAGSWKNQGAYASCVAHALNELRRAGVITGAQRARFLTSAIVAYQEEN